MGSDAASKGNRNVDGWLPAAPDPAPVSADSDWVARAQGGDREAFAHIYARYAPVVHGVLVAHAPWRDVHDLVQDVFVRALRSIGTLDEPAQLGPWLVSIARNRARDHAKRNRREFGGASELDTIARADAGASDESDADETARAVLAAIHALPESYRETLVLRLVAGLSGAEIAARTGLTHGSVRVNLFRGMKLLRERLARGGGGPTT